MDHRPARRGLHLTVAAALALGMTTGITAVTAVPASADTNYCDPDAGAAIAQNGIGAFQDSAKDFYREKFDWVASRFNVSRDIVCAAGSYLLNEGAESIVIGPVSGVVDGDPEVNPIPEDVMDEIWKQAIEHVTEQNDTDGNPLLVPVGPTEGSLPIAASWTIDDSILGGTWGRTNTVDGTWYHSDSAPTNGQLWYTNRSIGVSCALPGASYTVYYEDGTTAAWSWWVKTEDGLFVPAAVFDQVTSPAQPDGLPLCE